MNGNVEMLNFIHKNAQMGQDTINHLMEIVENDEFKKHLQSQFNEYKRIFDSAEEKMEQTGSETKGVSPLAKASTSMMIDMKTLRDKSSSHISEMLMKGSNMGIIDMTKNLKKYSDAQPDILELGNELLRIEENNIEQLKRFL